MQLLIATSNRGKIVEIQHELETAGLRERLTPIGLEDFPRPLPDCVEDRPTFLGNAVKKARHFAQFSGLLTLADDSGLCVAALGGAPGVLSARYAGEPCDNAANNAKLLQEMAQVPEERRQAKFVCAMALAAPTSCPGQSAPAAGEGGVELAVMIDEVHGVILRELRGAHGFGYDPLFFHPPAGKTTAELPMDEKGRLSHRGKALRRMLAWIKNHEVQLRALASPPSP